MDLVRLVTRFNLHPELDLHPSWLPTSWPVRHRRVQRYGPGGQAVLAELLRRRQPEGVDYNFDSRLKRLVLLDAASLRRLAAYCGLCAHLPLLRVRGGLAHQLRRQARRYDDDAVEFVLERVPQLTALKMSSTSLQERPIAAGRVIVNRGYRLLRSLVASEGEAVLQRLQHKLPRRVSLLPAPALQAQQQQQLVELLLLCIVPERVPQWDWLF
ncbi:SctK family type III secretion system sorting platform protein [Caldimonas brevitalea]|uniref:Type III secretion system protein n=1 Tax=Caldimonas brevitalea TaxID=413882 RepID=A0A0G3BRM3_9BURK|nr:SctK family type III secretion system sorting platform protein [Caldimonas brevitalea]AKJ32079.1 type III secretion system protein [Caldimonas brevitalea]